MIDWLNDNSGFATSLAAFLTFLATALLVIATFRYVLHTGRTVEEMRNARAAAILPSINLSLFHPGGPVGFVVIANHGVGPALDVRVTIAYGADGPRIEWTTPLMPPGSSERFLAPDRTVEMDDLIHRFGTIRLFGSCHDALGNTHQVDDVIELREYWMLNKAASRLHVEDYEKKSAEELEKIRRALEDVQSTLRASRAALRPDRPE